MATEMGEYIAGAYLKLILGCGISSRGTAMATSLTTGFAGHIGTIEEGKAANLVLIDWKAKKLYADYFDPEKATPFYHQSSRQ